MNVELAPEFALLLDAAVPAARPRAVPRAFDTQHWGRVLRAADWHRLSPLLFCYLNGSDSAPEPPSETRATLEEAYFTNAARNLFISSTLDRVTTALAAAGVPAIPLKGAALLGSFYPDAGQRELLDLDVLVPSDRLGAGTAALAAIGYRPDDGNEYGRHVPAYEEHHDAPLVGDEEIVAVELHRHLTIDGEGTRFDIQELWNRATPAESGTHLDASAEDLLLHVCVHFTRNRLGGSSLRNHTGGALAQICDIDRIIGRAPIDWEQLGTIARRYRLDTRLFLALFAARELGVAVPEAALRDLRPTGFDPVLGRRLVALRVLRSGDHLPVRSLRWMVAPSREVLVRGWSANPSGATSLARAYVRRARAKAPLARSALRQPWATLQDHRLNHQLQSLEARHG